MRAAMFNPDEAAAFGKWSDPEFLANMTDLNRQMTKTQFGDFHSHGWVFRAVFRHDREGKLLDRTGRPVADVTPATLQAAMKVPEAARDVYRKKHETLDALRGAEHAFEEKYKGMPIHYMDVHLEKGMHCVDCHFVQDMHGNRGCKWKCGPACEIQCIDCHGTVRPSGATLRTSGPASYTSSKDPNAPGRDLLAMRTPGGKRRFERSRRQDLPELHGRRRAALGSRADQRHDQSRSSALQQESAPRQDRSLRRRPDGLGRRLPPELEGKLRATPIRTCRASPATRRGTRVATAAICRSGPTPRCRTCTKEGDVTRNYTPYNFQTLRDDVYMLGRDGDVTGNRIGPARSSVRRPRRLLQQQSRIDLRAAADDLGRGPERHRLQHECAAHRPRHATAPSSAPIAMSRKNNDNNAMDGPAADARHQLHELHRPLLLGRGRRARPGRAGRHRARRAAGRHRQHAALPGVPRALRGARRSNGRKLEARPRASGPRHLRSAHASAQDSTKCSQVQNRGEYLYAACGEDGLRVFDIAFIDDKAFSERITTAPVSPLGQQFYVRTKNARAIASPTTIAPDPTRTHRPGKPRIADPRALRLHLCRRLAKKV